jgi:hypothetical protein
MMTGQQHTNSTGVRHCPPPPKDFDPFTASKADLIRYGLPLRPDPHSEPGMAALWERKARRYRHYDHLEPRIDTTTTAAAVEEAAIAPALGVSPIESCGYELRSSAPFTALFVTWTVPDLSYSPGQFAPINRFHTFVGLGFLDVHVEMTVDPQQNVTSAIFATAVGPINLPVRPGDVLSASLCLNTNPEGTASYFFTNETRAQTLSFAVDTGFPPAVEIAAGVSRGLDPSEPPDFHPLARFGVVYFDEISAFTTDGSRSLTSGQAITMVDQHGNTLASPERLTDFTFKPVFVFAGSPPD